MSDVELLAELKLLVTSMTKGQITELYSITVARIKARQPKLEDSMVHVAVRAAFGDIIAEAHAKDNVVRAGDLHPCFIPHIGQRH